MELYIHIPYCVKKCRYCDFVSFSDKAGTMAGYVDSVIEEAELRNEEANFPQIDTVYIGGGTPSFIDVKYFEKLLSSLRQIFSIDPDAEFTCEGNPGTITPQWLDIGVKNGINRISLGMQAYQNHLLKELGRIHNFAQVEKSVELCKNAGIHNINIDLMFGLPNQTTAEWIETLHHALELNPSHLSCYSLIVEDNTPIKADIDSGILTLPDEETDRRMYDDTISVLKANGFYQYEISNFAKPGFQCRHNIGYWKQEEYIGLGVAASSMLKTDKRETSCRREKNTSSIEKYIAEAADSKEKKQSRFDREIDNVNQRDAQYETLMLNLRMNCGVSEREFENLHHISLENAFGAKLHAMEKLKLLEHKNGCWRMTRDGLDLQNYVLVELMD